MKKISLVALLVATPSIGHADDQALLRRLEALESQVGRLSALEAENKQLRAELKKTGVRREKVAVSAPAPAPAPIPVSASQPIRPVTNWQGFYAGVNGGYGANTNMRNWSNMTAPLNALVFNTYYFPPYAGSEDTYFAGGTAGLQFGYNHMLTDRVMLGLETDINWANIYNQNTAVNKTEMSVYFMNAYQYGSNKWYPAIAQYNSNYSQTALEAIGTTRFRLGYSFGAFMPYITGGVAYGMVSNERKNTNVFGYTSAANISGYMPPPYSIYSSYAFKINAGFAVGAGFEYMMTDNWSTKFEYLYTSIGQVSFKNTSDVYNMFALHQARIGLNYHIDLSSIK